MASHLNLKSFAKINWTLDVLHRRDDGYHELRTIYQTVSLHDSLSLTETSGAIEVACDDQRVPTDQSNLAYKAALRFREVIGQKRGVRIEIRKRIPVAGGLGGGSSNAAAVLLALGRMWNADIDERVLIEVAAGLGSDVPFFLIGGTALGVGRGEEVYSISQSRCDHILLVNPGFAVPTVDAYARVSRLTRVRGTLIIPFTFWAAKGISELPYDVRNDLEEAILPAYPEIAEVKRRLFEAGARMALMSGSGATVFGVFDNSETLRRAAEVMRAIGYWAESARTIDRQTYQGAIFE
jgi:4-diphosphocytidyl-2-C-methyl-D-erythritol kinase